MKDYWREFDKRSKHVLLGDHFINILLNYTLNGVRKSWEKIDVSHNLGLKGDIHPHPPWSPDIFLEVQVILGKLVRVDQISGESVCDNKFSHAWKTSIMSGIGKNVHISGHLVWATVSLEFPLLNVIVIKPISLTCWLKSLTVVISCGNDQEECKCSFDICFSSQDGSGKF